MHPQTLMIRCTTVGDEARQEPLLQFVGEESNKIALEIDLTTPLAYMWSRTDLDHYRWSGLLRPEHALERANLLLIRPYEPGKIPVVMVHGLASTPLAWIPMLNELLRNPKIQKHYQFLLYMYPTGVPVPIAAASLRESLLQAKQLYNPDGHDPAFDQMVLLGHSMGGILSRMMAVSSGDKLWRLYSDRTFDDILGPRPVLDELRRYFFFEPLPFVSRVVFLATPHRGSDYSRGVVGRVSSKLISEPDSIHKLLYQLVKDNPDAFNSRQFRPFPTSIESLDPESPILAALLSMQPLPPPRQVPARFHSIIGSLRPTGVDSRQPTEIEIALHRAATVSIETFVVDERVVRPDHGVAERSWKPSARSATSSASTSAYPRFPPASSVQPQGHQRDSDPAASWKPSPQNGKLRHPRPGYHRFDAGVAEHSDHARKCVVRTGRKSSSLGRQPDPAGAM